MSDPSYVLLATVGTNDFILPDNLLAEVGRKSAGWLKDPAIDGYWSKEAQDLDDKTSVNLVHILEKAIRERSYAREWGKKFREDYKHQPEKYNITSKNFPILQKAITYTIDGVTINRFLSRIILFATDSEREPTDTIIYAQIIKELLPNLVKSHLRNFTADQIFVVPLKSRADLYGEIHEEICTKFEEEPYLQEILNEKPFDKVIVSPTAGTPAMSFALFDYCYQNIIETKKQRRFRPIYISDERQNG